MIRKLNNTAQDVVAAKKESDVHMNAYLVEEQTGKSKNSLFVISHEEIMARERSIEVFRHEEVLKGRIVGDLSSARDKAARRVSQQVCLRLSTV